MAASSNGKVVVSAPKDKSTNGHVVIKPKKPTMAKKSKKRFSLFSTATRLLTWYSIITILLRCPSKVDLVTDSSPQICKPYFQLRSTVAPHLEPYYHRYAAPYVESARPYYNTLDQKIITPVAVLGKKYGAPRVAQAQAYGQAQWEKTLQPEVSKYQAVAKAKYDQAVAPHLNKVTAATGPYLDLARTNALATYNGHILPAFHAAQPYAAQGYDTANKFLVSTGIPYTKLVWTSTAVFLDRKVLPKLRILYGENVEPQLVRIGERLGRYRDGKKLQAVVEGVDSSSSASSASSTFSSISSSLAASAKTTSTLSPSTHESTTVSSTGASENSPLSEAEIRENAQKVVAKDLKTWQEKFSKAADEGADEIEERVTEITNRLIQNQANKVGSSLIIELEEAVKSNLESLKSRIISIVESKKDGEEAEESLNTAVRKAGVAIKDKAQAIRTWRQSYDAETNSLIGKSVKDTFDIIDHIRDLGLQEIGMRWAWTDGITHKDWTKYHALKSKFEEWRTEVENVITEHPGLAKARAASEDIESKAMDIAENAAMELARLKETGKWKISTNDSSDDFSTKYVPPAAANAAQKVAEKLSDATEAMVGSSSQGTFESVASVAGDAASSLSSSVIGTPQGSAESVASVAKESASSFVDAASSSIIGTSQGSVESLTSVASDKASSLSAKASASVLGTEPGMIEKASSSVGSAASAVSSSASSLSDAASSSVSVASESLSSASSSVASSLSKSAAEASTSLSSSASSASASASKKVWGGAMAASVSARDIIFDDFVDDFDENDETYSEKIQSMASAAGDKFSDVTRAVSEALAQPTSTQGSVERVRKLAASQYSSALAAASSALYGTGQGAVESMTSVASDRYANAVSAANAAIYGTPTPTLNAAASSASFIYQEALSQASQRYDQARSVISAQVSGTPKPVHEEMFSSAQSAYLGAVAAANGRLRGALSSASTAVYGLPTGAIESIQSVASSRLSEGLSAASLQYESAKRYIGPTSTPAAQKLLAQAQNQYYAGIGLAHARYSEFLDAASSAVMPTQTPMYQSIIDKASANIVGTSAPAYEAAMSQASEQYNNALLAAASARDNVLASISSVGSAAGDAVPTANLADVASSKYSQASVEASKSYASASLNVAEKMKEYASQASTAVYGSETPLTESVASVASQNWEALITKASHQVYGSPTPYFVTGNFMSNIQEYAAQATDGAASQYSAVQSLVSELVSGREPDFTESVYSRLSSAYYTGAGDAVSSASSYASAVYASASSVANSVFTPPPAIESILEAASLQINEAIDAASNQFYGSEKGVYEKATSSAASAYSSASAAASENIYGTQPSYAEQAQKSISDAAASAQKAISEAIYGTSTGTAAYESATKVIAESFESATSKAAESYSSAQAKVSEAIYGKEQGAVESAQARLNSAIESARARLSEFAANAGEGASDAISKASEGVEEMASSVSSVVEQATEAAKSKKDEL
ncbi:transcription factor protein [Rutstroemia sp. NJR-2017a WRK4]|nr:transcription factor protein [Rutstroemia sp. NJR-2017a WRK4]PQE11737.1 transcription factor protein [Rutstroemia sp. NJR-2017a WRK4]